jgi:hypothetical protein
MTTASIPVHAPQWRAIVEEKLPLLGHRNWIVVADSAYPWPASAGIDTVATGSDHVEVLQGILEALARSRHVRPVVYLDAELPFVAEAHAPGVAAFREGLAEALAGEATRSLPHEEIIDLLEEAGRSFRVLLLKTKLTLPYTSVFVRLECGYWSEEAEKALRAAIGAG